MSQSVSRSVARMFLLALAIPSAVPAQTTGTADLRGVVLDASGQPAVGYPMKIMTQQWGQVIMKPTEGDGTFGADGLPPGDYEVRVFDPSGSSENPIASRKVTLAAGQKEQLEIRIGSDNPGSKSAAGSLAGAALGMTWANWTNVLIAALLLGSAVAVFFAVRSRRRPVE